MPEPLNPSDDLVKMCRAAYEAEAAITAFFRAHPEPWEDYTSELREEAARLRRELANAHAAIGQHAIVLEALAQGCRHQTVEAARRMAREQMEAVV